MRRIQLLTTLADPSGVRFPGWEVDMPDEQAELLVSTGQWKYVTPPDVPAVKRSAPDAPAAPQSARRREFRGKGKP